jgi:hypothetical protein
MVNPKNAINEGPKKNQFSRPRPDITKNKKVRKTIIEINYDNWHY